MPYPSKTYKIDLEHQRIVGTIDEREAVMQFIKKTLSTDKYAWDFYDQNFGNEIKSLMGKSKGYIMAQFPHIVDRALLTDDRIVRTYDYEYFNWENITDEERNEFSKFIQLNRLYDMQDGDWIVISFWISTIYSEEQYTVTFTRGGT